MIPERLFSDEMPLNPILYNKTEQQDSLFIFPMPSYKIIKAIIAIFAARKVIYYLSHADRQKTNRIHRPCKRSVYFTGCFRPHTPRLDTLFLGCIFRLVPHAALFFPLGYFFQKIQRHTRIRHKESQQPHHSTPFLLCVCLPVRRRIMGYLSFVGIRYVDLRTILVVAFLGNHSLGNDLSQPTVMVPYGSF